MTTQLHRSGQIPRVQDIGAVANQPRGTPAVRNARYLSSLVPLAWRWIPHDEACADFTRNTVLSFVVQLSRDEYVLYYPLVSLINAEYQVQATLKPRYEFGFEGNVLHNEFAIPAGASWLLVHTSAEFYRSDFVGSTSKRGSGGGAAASFVGGAIGGAIVMSLAQGKERPFRFGEIGLIAVVRD